MNRGRVGEERGGKETEGCPLTGGPLVKLKKLMMKIILSSTHILLTQAK
jgi:hypothetical protein